MVNINAHLPPTVAAAFHPPTEGLQHDNVIKPVIPKTEVIASYAKMRDDQQQAQISSQARDIIQENGSQKDEAAEQQESSSGKRRSDFFARRADQLTTEPESSEKQLSEVEDFKLVVSVIQARYKSAVSPVPEPMLSYAV